jgi:hypothetical protein
MELRCVGSIGVLSIQPEQIRDLRTEEGLELEASLLEAQGGDNQGACSNDRAQKSNPSTSWTNIPAPVSGGPMQAMLEQGSAHQKFMDVRFHCRGEQLKRQHMLPNMEVPHELWQN